MITAIVLAKNEQDNIARCLKSLKWCDEVLVIDDYSQDNTKKIALKLKAKVLKHHLNGNFAKQRNFGLKKAKHQWVLYIDADEIVSKKLAFEIQKNITVTHVHHGYVIKRQDVFMGKKLKHGETAQVKLLRLAKKTSGKWQRPVHETWQIKGQIKELKHPLLHFPHQNLSQFYQTINYYTTIEAKYRLKTQSYTKLRTLFELSFWPLAKFIKNYILYLGFLDQVPGLIMALMMSYHSLLVRVKIFEALMRDKGK